MDLCRSFVWASLVFPCVSAANQAGITIRIQDYADVGSEHRSEAFAVVERIFKEAGVAPAWIDCSPSLSAGRDPVCDTNKDRGLLILRLMPERMANRYTTRSASVGYAIIPPPGARAMFASVFVERVRRRAQESGALYSRLLGHVIAHEIAHLLLRTTRHGSHGLMRANWKPGDMRETRGFPMTFTAAEVRVIQRNLETRNPWRDGDKGGE